MTRALNSKYEKSFELKLGAISWCNTLNTLVQHVEVCITSSEFDCRKASIACRYDCQELVKKYGSEKVQFSCF